MTLTAQVAVVHSDRGLAARLVQGITGSAWNHIIVAINDTHCLSAEPGGAIVRPISYYDDHLVVWSRFELDAQQRRRIVNWAWQHVGVPYSWPDFIAAGISSLTKRATPRWLRRFVARPDRLICSQLCDLALQAGGLHLFADHRPAGAVTPASFGALFVELGWSDTP
ncbi:hypothetical protein [Agromyces sp. NPDC058064]|uniref:hypothetical protein n=1 Tax=Agromyces sp. NPDC058064 TaxID=3346322 RepID=UPI0036DF1380